MDSLVSVTLPVLCLISVYLFITDRRSSLSPSNLPTYQDGQGKAEKLLQLRRIFLSANLLALLADWLQGPYIHRLYTYHGHTESNIALLFLAGYVSSCFLGSFTGPLADKFGRKFMAQVFCIVYAVCCLTKISSNLHILLLGRVFSGVSTSCLHSVFESWYVAEHNINSLNPEEISNTLSLVSLLNSNLAIGAGIFADFLVRDLDLAPTAPFLAALPPLILSFVIIGVFWRENFGDKSKNLVQTYQKGLAVIKNNTMVMKLGAVQALVESSMFTFVYLWTPTLSTSQRSIPLGRIFSCFMVCIMIGSFIFRRLVRRLGESKLLLLSTCVFLACNLGPSLLAAPHAGFEEVCFLFFLGIELSLGIYFPAIGTLRSSLIPEQQRSTVINLFRIPLNAMTVAALLLVKSGIVSDHRWIFLLTSCLLFGAATISTTIHKQPDKTLL